MERDSGVGGFLRDGNFLAKKGFIKLYVCKVSEWEKEGEKKGGPKGRLGAPLMYICVVLYIHAVLYCIVHMIHMICTYIHTYIQSTYVQYINILVTIYIHTWVKIHTYVNFCIIR